MSDEPQYALFAGDHYYPLGGWDDYVDTFETIAEARAGVAPTADWAHVVDLSICERVSTFARGIGWS